MRGNNAINNIATTLFMQITIIICGFIVPRAIIGNYGSDVNGLILSITQFLGYITLLEAGIGPVIKSILYKPIANKDKTQIENILSATQKLFRKIAYIFIAYIVILCIVFQFIMKEEFGAFFTISLVVIIAISTFAEYFFGMTYRLYLQAEQKMYVYSIIQICAYIINTIVIIILIKLGCDIVIVKLVGALIFVLRPILQNIYVKKKYNINLNHANKDYEIKQKYDGLAQHIASVIHNNTDIAILTIFSNLKEVSVYSVYMLVIRGVKSLSMSLSSGIDALFGDMLAKKEEKQLRKAFSIYELIYFSIITVIFSATLLLIVPFVEVYTKGITDTNYYRPTFAYLMVLAEFVCMIRLPYISITYAAGHFKETKKGAWIEAISNIIISIILVFKFGMIGVAIGTLISMSIRAIEFIIHSSKYILKRNIWESIFRIIIITIQVIVICIIANVLPQFSEITYLAWIKYACIITIISILVIIPTNLVIYRKDAQNAFNIMKNYIIKK